MFVMWGVKVIELKVVFFLDKLMMYCVSLFCSFGLGSNVLGIVFSLCGDFFFIFVSMVKDILIYG